MAVRQKAKKKGSRYIRVNVFPLDAVLPFVFTREVRHQLRTSGYKYNSPEWRVASRRGYPAFINGYNHIIEISMGSHRYQLFAEKGTTCVRCGLKGTYFALERGTNDNPNRFHFNLYGKDDNGVEVMITKDHIIPRAKGGKNRISNYQPMCYRCNQRKADKLPDDKNN